MSSYEGLLRLLGESGPGLGVSVDLSDERLRITAGNEQIGDWAKDEIRMHAESDGFHLRVEGEEIVLDLSEDAHFAVDYGLKSAPPVLRRRMASLMRDDV